MATETRDGRDWLLEKAKALRAAMASKGFALTLDEAGALFLAGCAARAEMVGLTEDSEFCIKLGRDLLAGAR